ncbi:hypothetical protein GCM10022286_20000 [Gryllotalpicola daejeonensis]|uniref:Uncharacterized protein n=1 Tax=Gryllotalpicola daejeonensis TaxID=993087 RepID=A0ABP7ZKM6_9MICO
MAAMDTANENTDMSNHTGREGQPEAGRENEDAVHKAPTTDTEAQTPHDNPVANGVAKATTWIDDKLVPILGPSNLGPYELDERDDPNPGVVDELCPVCHHAVSRHEVHVDEATGHTYRICPESGASYEIDAHAHTHAAGREPDTLDGPVLS